MSSSSSSLLAFLAAFNGLALPPAQQSGQRKKSPNGTAAYETAFGVSAGPQPSCRVPSLLAPPIFVCSERGSGGRD